MSSEEKVSVVLLVLFNQLILFKQLSWGRLCSSSNFGIQCYATVKPKLNWFVLQSIDGSTSPIKSLASHLLVWNFKSNHYKASITKQEHNSCLKGQWLYALIPLTDGDRMLFLFPNCCTGSPQWQEIDGTHNEQIHDLCLRITALSHGMVNPQCSIWKLINQCVYVCMCMHVYVWTCMHVCLWELGNTVSLMMNSW